MKLRPTNLLALAAIATVLGATSVHASTITTSWNYYTATGSGDTSWVAPASTSSVLAIDWGTAGSGTATTWGGIDWVGSNATSEAKNESGNVDTYYSKPGTWGTSWADNTFYPSSSFPLLGSGVTGEDDYKLEIKGLNPGQSYQIQFVIADSRTLAAPDDDRSVTISGTAGTTGLADNYRYGYSDGKYAVITANVIADAGGYAAFKPSGFNDNGSIGQQINAMQVLAVNNASLSWTAGTGTWSSTDTNWTGGVAWTGPTADAILNNASSATAITIDGSLTAATVLVGNSTTNKALYTFSGGTLNASAFIVQGADANDPGVGATTLNNVNLTTVGDVGVGRWDLVIGGTSTVNIGGQLRSTSNGAGSGDWGRVTIQDSANVTATGGVSSSGSAWGLTLNGGTLTTPSIEAVENGYGAGSRLTLNGTTMIATQDTGNFISVNTNQAYVGTNGAKFDTNGKNITVGVNLINTSGQNGTLTKLGAGTLTLTGANSYSGTTTISAGTLALSGSGTLGSGKLSLEATSATLDLGGTTQSLGTALSASGAGNGAVGTITNGTINLNGKNAYLQNGTFTMNLSGGGNSRLWIGGDAGATVELGGINTSTYADTQSTIIGLSPNTGPAGTVKLLSATALGPNGQNTQVHSGTLDLNGQTGVTVSQIALFGTSNLVNNNTGTAASFGGTVDFTSVNTPSIGGAGNTTLSGVLQTGGFTKTGAGTLTLSGTSNTYNGVTTIAGGTLNVATFSDYGVDGSLGNRASDADVGDSIGILFRGGTLQYTGSTAQSTNRAIRISTDGGAIIDASGSVPGATLSFTATSSPNLFENFGNRTLTLTGSNTGNNTFAMAITQAGITSLAKSGVGKWVLTGANNYSGTTTINAGTLQIGAGGTTGNLGSGAVTNNGTLAFNRSDALTVSNAISGSGSLTKSGADTLTLSGANTYSGGTTIHGGTVIATVEATPGVSSALGLAASTNIITINNGGVLTGSGNHNWLDNTGLASGGADAHSVVINADGKLTGAPSLITGLGNVTLNGGTIEVSNGLAAGYWNGSFTLGGDITVSGSAASSITTVGSGTAANIQMSDGLNNVGGTRTFTVNDVTNNPNSDLIVSARLANGTVIKAGAGTLELAVGATGTGTAVSWQVNKGKLQVNSGVTAGGATIAAGTASETPLAQLTGSGTIDGNVTLTMESSTDYKNGGVLAPTAAASGTKLSVTGTTTFGTGSIFEWDMSATDPATDPGVVPNSGSYGQLAGADTISGGAAVFNIVLGAGNAFTNAFWNSDKTWNNIFTGAGATNALTSIFSSMSGSGITYDSGLGRGNVGTEGYFTFNGTSTLNWTAVPEPTSALAGLLITAGLLRRRRKF